MNSEVMGFVLHLLLYLLETTKAIVPNNTLHLADPARGLSLAHGQIRIGGTSQALSIRASSIFGHASLAQLEA